MTRRALLDGRFEPTTWEVGFLEADCKAAAGAFVSWQEPIQRSRRVTLQTRTVSGDPAGILSELAPLTSVEARRFLFVPTRSLWTAYFDNGANGPDAMSTMMVMAEQTGSRGLRVVAVDDAASQRTAPPQRQAATILEVYAPHATDFINYQRSISVASDGGKWRFDQAGQPLPFEDLDRYKSRTVKSRFTVEVLERYLDHLGIALFDSSFYAPENWAVLVEKKGPSAPGLQEYPSWTSSMLKTDRC